MTLLDDLLYFTVGSKFSSNNYTGSEIQPTARLLYTPSERQSVWASVSRAIRVPSRVADDVVLLAPPTNVPVFPTFPTVLGDRDVESARPPQMKSIGIWLFSTISTRIYSRSRPALLASILLRVCLRFR